jgi:phenylacetic acid degradation operon negative regulatory protein
LLGLRELEYGLFVRPDNLSSSIDNSRQRLLSLGLEPDAAVFVARQFDDEREHKARQLWNGKALSSAYEQTRQQLESWMARADQLELDQAARESYLLGDKAIRQLVFDPLLPAPLVDTAARAAFTETVLRFDRAGHLIWRNFALRPQSSNGVRTTARAAH